MTPEQQKIERLERRVEQLERLIGVLWPPRKRGEDAAADSGGTPAVIGDDIEPDDGGYSDEWAIADGTPVDVWVSMGSSYDDTGDETLYGNKVRMRIDASGRIYAVDTPTQYEIDPADDC